MRHVFGRYIGSGILYDDYSGDEDLTREPPEHRRRVYDSVMIPKGTKDAEIAARCGEVKCYKLGGQACTN